MPPVKVKSTGGIGFAETFKRRAEELRSARIAARIQVPTDLKWWYWLEFGTATRQMSDAPVRGRGSKYPIEPIDRGNAGTLKSLHWGPFGAGTFAAHVEHPGIRPHPFVRASLGMIMRQFRTDIVNGIRERGFSADVLRSILFDETMIYAKAKLVESLSVIAPGTREDGNLLGNSASSVFDEEAEIVDGKDFAPGTGAVFNVGM